MTLKYDSAGVEISQAIYDGPAQSYDAAQAIALGKGGRVYVTGYVYGSNPTFNDYATVAYKQSRSRAPFAKNRLRSSVGGNDSAAFGAADRL